MSNSISTLLLRNLSDVFGENDPVRRRAAIDEIFHEDAVFYDPKGGIFRGRDEIDRIAGVIKATHPDFEYQPLFPPEELGDAGRVRWVSGTPGKPPAYAGTDFIVARNGRIASVYFNFMPHFMDSYFAAQIHKVQSSGLDPATTAAQVAAIQRSQQLYQNPFVNMAYTFMEPLPVGLIITLISAAVLRRKSPAEPTANSAVMPTYNQKAGA